MNPGLPDDHASIEYYDGDYPSPDGPYPENFDHITVYQGVAKDVSRYIEIARETNGPILEPFCGTGRVLISLAQDGHQITGVDVSAGLLAQCRKKVQNAPNGLVERVTLIEEDITRLHLGEKTFRLAVVAFNSLLCIPDFAAQTAALGIISTHLLPGGLLALDIVNPLRLKIDGDPVPKPFFTRRNPGNGNLYTRFATFGPFDEQHRQKLEGWYDEILPDGTLRRRLYAMVWRPIFRYEIELMLEKAGFDLLSIEGGHAREPYTAGSPRMFIVARRRV